MSEITTQELLDKAWDYFELAREHLLGPPAMEHLFSLFPEFKDKLPTARQREAYFGARKKLVAMYVVSWFLFPQLNQPQLRLMAYAHLMTNSVQEGLDTKLGEQFMGNAEIGYMDAKDTIEKEICPLLTDTQKKLVNEHYVKVHFGLG